MTDKTLPPFTIHGGSTASLDTLVRKKHNMSQPRDRRMLYGIAAAVVLAVLVSGSIVLAFYLGEIAKQPKSPHEVSESTNDEYEEMLLELVGGSNCSEITDAVEKLKQREMDLLRSAVDVSRHVEFKEYLRGRASEIQCEVDESYFFGDEGASDSEESRVKRSWSRYCPARWVGDGWCDPGCNTAGDHYDDGDCCPDTCGTRPRRYRCGIVGYNCLNGGPPAAFTSTTRLCFNWYGDEDARQCQGRAPELCANIDKMTPYYRDDTDHRPGGCRMRWRIESSYSASWFQNVQLCYRWYADDSGHGQCGSAGGGGPNGEFCAAVNRWTKYYRDDTDNRWGGCRMSWRLKLPYNAPAWASELKLCYYWYADGDGGQCGGGVSRQLCARANSYTPYYRDDTDGRSGGCRMSWGIKLN